MLFVAVSLGIKSIGECCSREKSLQLWHVIITQAASRRGDRSQVWCMIENVMHIYKHIYLHTYIFSD
jgi:hypothetical protein